MKQGGLHNNGGRSADFYPGLSALVGCRNVFLPEPELQLSLPPQSCSAFLSNYPRVQSTSSFWTAARILSNCPPSPPPPHLICVSQRYLDSRWPGNAGGGSRQRRQIPQRLRGESSQSCLPNGLEKHAGYSLDMAASSFPICSYKMCFPTNVL